MEQELTTANHSSSTAASSSSSSGADTVESYRYSVVDYFSEKVFWELTKGEWVCAAVLNGGQEGKDDVISTRTIRHMSADDESKTTNILDFAEGLNYLLNLFSHGSKFQGKVMFLIGTDKLWGKNKQSSADNLRFIFDLVMDNPDKIMVCSVNWGSELDYDGMNCCSC